MEKILHNIYQATVSSARCFFPLGNSVYRHTKFTFFYFNSKIRTCSLLSSVTLKSNNEIGSNSDSSHLKDCISRKKYENLICGGIPVSSYALIKLTSSSQIGINLFFLFPFYSFTKNLLYSLFSFNLKNI